MSREPKVDISSKVSDEVKKTTCYMCACRCGINVHVRDNKIRYISVKSQSGAPNSQKAPPTV